MATGRLPGSIDSQAARTSSSRVLGEPPMRQTPFASLSMLPSPSSLESAYRSTPSTFACTDVKSPLWEEAMSLVARMTSIYSMLALWKIMQQCKQYAQNTRRYSAAFGVTETAETDFRISLFPFVDLGECN